MMMIKQIIMYKINNNFNDYSKGIVLCNTFTIIFYYSVNESPIRKCYKTIPISLGACKMMKILNILLLGISIKKIQHEP